jgi:hypothetical protein
VIDADRDLLGVGESGDLGGGSVEGFPGQLAPAADAAGSGDHAGAVALGVDAAGVGDAADQRRYARAHAQVVVLAELPRATGRLAGAPAGDATVLQ